MRRLIFTISFMVALTATAIAQKLPQNFQRVTIEQIQERSQSALGNCDDASPFITDTLNPGSSRRIAVGDTVVTSGTAIVDGGVSTSRSGRDIWIADDNSEDFAGLNVHFRFDGQGENDETAPTDLQDVLAGDRVNVLGVVQEFEGQTQINPLPPSETDSSVWITNTGTAPEPMQVSISDFVTEEDPDIASGEKFEGRFVELKNVEVVEVRDFGTRRFPVVQDDQGNTMGLSDRFPAGRTPNDSKSPGTFEVPAIGTVYESVKGIVFHDFDSRDSDQGGCVFNESRGYEINPFKKSHYQTGSAPPVIKNINIDPMVPTPDEDVTISANITDDGSVDTAKIHWLVGSESDNSFNVSGMTKDNLDIYSVTIPASQLSDGDFIKFYIEASDNESSSNEVPNPSNPAYTVVRSGGLKIADVQQTPSFASQNAFTGEEVTLSGVVTATTDDLQGVVIQEEGASENGAIVTTGSGDAYTDLSRGEKASLTGTVNNNFGLMRLENVSSVQTNGTGSITPTEVKPSVFSDNSSTEAEAMEGHLVSLQTEEGDSTIEVLNTNADAPDNNFAEWVVSKDSFTTQGARILTGRQSNNAFSSLSVSYVNDAKWESEDGSMSVSPKVIEKGDQFESITGVVYFSFGNYKILPRDNDDVVPTEPLSLAGQLEATGVGLYPNPASQQVTVELDQTVGQGSVMLYNTAGQEVASSHLSGGQNTVDLSGLNPGFYVVRIADSQGAVLKTTKLMVTR